MLAPAVDATELAPALLFKRRIMIRTPVASSNLCAVGYDFTSRTLEIEFNDGSVYRYSGVPENVYRALMSAGSHGRYFAAFIKDCYPYRRVL